MGIAFHPAEPTYIGERLDRWWGIRRQWRWWLGKGGFWTWLKIRQRERCFGSKPKSEEEKERKNPSFGGTSFLAYADRTRTRLSFKWIGYESYTFPTTGRTGAFSFSYSYSRASYSIRRRSSGSCDSNSFKQIDCCPKLEDDCDALAAAASAAVRENRVAKRASIVLFLAKLQLSL